MSEKTELPTEHKRREAAKKGQVFNPRDLCDWISLSMGIAWLTAGTDWSALLAPLRHMRGDAARLNVHALIHDCATAAIGIVAPLLVIVVVTPAAFSLCASRFELASEALVPDISRLDPIKGFGRIFSLRSINQLVCALAYCAAAGTAVRIFAHLCGRDVFGLVLADPASGKALWMHIVVVPLSVTLACVLPVCLLHAFCERRLHTRELRMEKREVKQEMRDHEGKPEVRARRRDLLFELLDAQTRHDISDSRFVLANPTHIAVGIYFNETLIAWPFVSVRETNRRALAVIDYAESIGVPVIRNRRLARAVYQASRRYGFVSDSVVDELLRIVTWLADVENAQMTDAPATESKEIVGAGDAQGNHDEFMQAGPECRT
ncbi:Secretion apparatus protein BsaZ [Pararobbsia alpina]|uniref:EscU/YscU/HrcU family type III secretion system export apparatus switch protein n=1 Tax=Pararobbsia alpina TaxID=621374 RepID=UPI0039A5C5A9